MPEEVQHVQEHALSPQCFDGQHPDCKHTVSWMGEDGVGRTMVCPCRCHERAPKAKSAADEPEFLYSISWEYEVKNDEGSAWLKRKVITTSKEMAGDWIDAVAELTKTNSVRMVSASKAPLGDWVVVG